MKKILVLLIITSLVITSCQRNGYGCHGRGKYITRVR